MTALSLSFQKNHMRRVMARRLLRGGRRMWSNVPESTGVSFWDDVARGVPRPVSAAALTFGVGLVTYSSLMWLMPPPDYNPPRAHGLAFILLATTSVIFFFRWRLPPTTGVLQ